MRDLGRCCGFFVRGNAANPIYRKVIRKRNRETDTRLPKGVTEEIESRWRQPDLDPPVRSLWLLPGPASLISEDTLQLVGILDDGVLLIVLLAEVGEVAFEYNMAHPPAAFSERSLLRGRR